MCHSGLDWPWIGEPFRAGLALDWPWIGVDWGGLARDGANYRVHGGIGVLIYFSYSKTDFATAGDAPEDFQRPSKILTI